MAEKPEETRYWIKIQAERVMRDIIARRRLTLQELAVSTLIWEQSWGFGRATTNPEHPITTSWLQEWTCLSYRSIQHAVKLLKERTALIIHPDGSWEFNEHIETWKAPESLAKESFARRAGIIRLKRRNHSSETPESFVSLPYSKTTQTTQTTQTTPTPESFASNFSEIYRILRSINARVYRDLVSNDQFEELLASESKRLGGVSAVVAIAQRFAVWLEEVKLQTGDESREKRHNPRSRFTRWLAREEPSTDNTEESSTDRSIALLRKLEMDERRQMEMDQEKCPQHPQG